MPHPGCAVNDRQTPQGRQRPSRPTLPAEGPGAVAEGGSLQQGASLAASCRGCDLWARATQTVFGHGPAPAPVMLVGEQPGDSEDVLGEPFVGPAGKLLDRALADAGIDRAKTFVTNVVKHFKWRPSPGGKRRLHEKPSRAEVVACHPWLEAELELVRPQALVCLGATAATALLGPGVRVTELARTAVESSLAPLVLVTLHPSAVLRARDAAARESAYQRVVGDLRIVAEEVEAARPRHDRGPRAE